MSRIRLPISEVTPPKVTEQGVMIPHCMACLHTIEVMEDSVMCLKGQWMPNLELGEPVFVLDVDSPLKFVQLPNGQYALVTDPDGVADEVVLNMHEECLTRMIDEVNGCFSDGGDDEEDYFR